MTIRLMIDTNIFIDVFTKRKSNNLKGIVTRNKSDFESFGIDLYSPEEIINII